MSRWPQRLAHWRAIIVGAGLVPARYDYKISLLIVKKIGQGQALPLQSIRVKSVIMEEN
jgi:hypothetical protein